MKRQNNTDAELTPEGAYPHKLECVMAKLGLSFTISSLFQHQTGDVHGPQHQYLVKEWACNSWLQQFVAAAICCCQTHLRCSWRDGSRKEKKEEKNQIFELRLCPFLL